MIVGLISDTHGLLRPEAISALRGVDRILHAGDVGGREVLERLAVVAPIEAVRGNNDRDAWGRTLPEVLERDLGGVRVRMIHDRKELGDTRGINVVISGHSHRPSIETVGGVLYVNPGSAGPRRFSLPVAIGVLTIDRGRARAEIITLDVTVKLGARKKARA
jgi:putative phosphoesterase